MKKLHWPWWRPKDIAATAIPLWDFDLVFRINHRMFDSKKVYRAVALVDYGPASTAHLVFINERGFMWFVPQNRAFCVSKRTWGAASAEHLAVKFPQEKIESDWA